MPINPSTLQGRVIVDEMIRGGVTDAVLCPGSRNAPLAFALHAADAAGRIRLHVRIDERSAGYLALGLAVSSRRPVPIVLTSGTAVANVSPAVFEANYARVPLVVVSANRPYELLGSGANQTVEQFGLFGTQVRAAISIGLAEDGVDTNSQWRSAVGRVLAAARGARTGNAGPVQFDIPLREPLVPDPQDPSDADLGAFAGRPDGQPWTYAPAGRLDIPVPIDLSLDTVVIAGHGAGANPELAGLPTVAEPTAPVPDNPLHPLALRAVKPRQAIICGRPTLHRDVSRLLADPDVAVHAITTGPRWPDVSGNVVSTGTRAEPVGAPRDAWLADCAQAHRRTVGAVSAVLADTPAVTGLHVAAAVGRAVGPGRQLFLGASNPIRDVALAAVIDPGARVLSNRGVAGIDGTNSTAIGAALAADGTAAGGSGSTGTVALMGDLTFIHDTTGLIIGPGEPRPADLRIVVANDDGGGIFGLLEQGDPRFNGDAYAGAYERIFGTPHHTDLAALCAGVRVGHRRLTVEELGDALAAPATGAPGPIVLEVATDRTVLREVHAAIAARLDG